MSLQIFNSWSRRLERFESLAPGRVRMYSCGPTVYSRAHLGNLRAYVVADTLRRTLRWRGYDVDHVINVTDVGHLLADADQGEDKVERAAGREGRSVWELTVGYQRLFEEDLAKLDVLPPRRWTKASDHVGKMIDFARRLEALGHTYRLPAGLYFDTASVAGYGVLATIDHERLEADARIEAVPGKRHRSDFALWRTTPPGGPVRAMEWDSPWGPGAPGWHLGCSVMSMDQLGPHFDVHTGGVDHREIHHPNEDAQSRAYLADQEPWVRYWVHHEFVTFAGEKMAKSTGNVLILDDVVRRGLEPLAYRLLLLQSHYRSQVRVTLDDIAAANTFLDRLVRAVGDRLDELSPAPPLRRHDDIGGRPGIDALDEALTDDLATPRAVAWLHQGVHAASGADDLTELLAAGRDLLGLDLRRLAEHRRTAAAARAGDDDRHRTIGTLVAERDRARRRRDYRRADALRDQLRTEFAVELADGPERSTWRIVRTPDAGDAG
ncbi:MAG TPA: cysteine--tRNA ligase [Acidimicrobiia bacterium]|nr:cysteine--tRNA ligase [Acidimicrobiia bacterium]